MIPERHNRRSGSSNSSSMNLIGTIMLKHSTTMLLSCFCLYYMVSSSLSMMTVVMAVDRSKFRTCDQTSFCRRHRYGAHKDLFHYKLLKDTVHFVHNSTKKTNDAVVKDDHEDEHPNGGGGVWQSLSRSLLGGNSGKKSKTLNALDPYILGPSPTITGLLQNTVNNEEVLNLTVSCYEHGMIRVRVTELYGTKGSPYENARITYDELVLTEIQQLQSSGHALLIKDIQSNDNIKKLITDSTTNYDNYMALQYGDINNSDNTSSNSMILVIQIEPLMLSLYRETESIPIVVLGHEQMMHYEIRRLKQDGDNKKQKEEVEKLVEKEAEEVKEEKEIVGYWEDGLAIYADGTREEKKDVDEEDNHRQLTETELDQEGLWEESFSSHTDSKPYGPMSVGMDISFPASQHIFGIPEHASSTILQTTATSDDENHPSKYKEPYRLYNLDVFEYELDETMALYGHVPLVVSQSMTTQTVGVFWFNPTETFVEVQQNDKISTNKPSMTTHWISESGIIDVFILPGPDPKSMYKQYSMLTGTTPIPPMFALGYHQCRWNYKDEKDVYMVHAKFEEYDYPYDVLWLDIEHTDGKMYFTWDSHHFPNPTTMINKLAETGRKMVTIIDPHIKRDDSYYIHKEATSKSLYIKDKDKSKDYDGWCWPGSSSYLDFTSSYVRNWWAQQFAYNKYIGSTPTLYTWNDMNEPSVFNGPEISMQKDLRNLNNVEHREWHNLYGMLFHRSTTEGQIYRNQPDQNIRPFVLSRSFFAGSQKYGAIWTGDNKAEWEHLVIAAPMLLSLNIAALSFVGADVGGFFGNPDSELFIRWMQAGSYQPFFRGHAHHDSKRREPWMFDDETLYRLRHSSITRYALLPYWYTAFHIAEQTGMPVMRTMWMQYSNIEALYHIDDQYIIGTDLLVKPITASQVSVTDVLFPSHDIWYDANTLKLMNTKTVGGDYYDSVTVPAPLDIIPVFQRGGSIITRKLRLRRSTVQMKTDPYTIYVALDTNQNSTGMLYMDDEDTFSYQRKDEYAISQMNAYPSGKSKLKLQNIVQVGSGWNDFINTIASDRLIERIVIMMGNHHIKKSPKTIEGITGNGSGSTNVKLSFTYTQDINVITIRKPDITALADWEILISY